MKKSFIAAALLLALSAPSWATNKCEYGGKWPNCNPPPTEEPEPTDPGQSQSQQQNQTANGGDGGDSTAIGGGGTGIGLGVGTGGNATGGAGGHGGAGGNAAATGGNAGATAGASSGSSSGAVSGSLSGANAGASNGDQSTSIGPVGSTSGAASQSGASIGDTTVRNGSESSSGASSYSGGNTLDSTSGASADGSGNSETSVSIDAADRSSNSYTSQSLWLPQIETAAPAIVASPVVTIVPGTCGPRVKRISERVEGVYVGIIKKSSIPLGTDDVAVEMEAEPFKYHEGRNGLLVEGSKVDYAVFAVGVAASRGLGLGGGETGGNWGQGGVSSNSSIQRPIVRALITPCLMKVAEPDLPVISFDTPRIPRG